MVASGYDIVCDTPLDIRVYHAGGSHHAVLFWDGAWDYRGSASDLETARFLAEARGRYIVTHRAEAESTRIPVKPETAELLGLLPMERP